MKFTQLYPVGFISSLDAKDGRVERKADSQLRYICGWMTEAAVPSESTFSRAFADFARHKLPGKVVDSVAVGTIIADRPPPQIRTGATHAYGSYLGFWLQSEARDKDAAREASAAKPGLARASGLRQAARSDCAFSAHATSIDLPVPEIA